MPGRFGSGRSPQTGPNREPKSSTSPPPPPSPPSSSSSPKRAVRASSAARAHPRGRRLGPAAPLRRLSDRLGVRRRVERYARLLGGAVAGLLVPGRPGARRGLQWHSGQRALARVGAPSTGPQTDGAAHRQPRGQQRHTAPARLVPAARLPQPLRPPRHVPLPRAGE